MKGDQNRWKGGRFLVALSFFIANFVSGCGCERSQSTTDNDISGTCAGRCGTIGAVVCGPCEYGYTCNKAQYCVEITNDNVVLQDDEDIGGESDEDVIPDCPALKQAKFPYYDEKGKIHFCRKCDLPAKVDDPQCVRNLWDTPNKSITTQHPEKDCYPYPCRWEYAPEITSPPEGVCDKYIIYKTTQDMFAGKYQNAMTEIVGSIIYISNDDDLQNYDQKIITYNINKNEYRSIMPASPGYGYYYNDRHIGLVIDYNAIYANTETAYLSANSYLISYQASKGYQVIMNEKIHQYINRPYFNEKWIMVEIMLKGEETYRRFYAKIDEWIWREMKIGSFSYKSLSGNNIALSGSDDGMAYICDLSKLPTTLEDCIKLNRSESEQIYIVEMDKSRSDRYIYSVPILNRASQPREFYQGIIGGAGIVETQNVPIEWSEQQMYGIYPAYYNGEVLLYNEWFFTSTGSDDQKACIYIFSKHKSYCPKPTASNYSMKNGSLDGKNLVWRSYRGDLILRDMNCYCEKEGVCPFAGMKK